MALALDLPMVRGALLISGIYDLEPIRIASLNDAIRMDWAESEQDTRRSIRYPSDCPRLS